MYIQIDDLTCLFGADEDSVAEEIKQSEPERAAQGLQPSLLLRLNICHCVGVAVTMSM